MRQEIPINPAVGLFIHSGDGPARFEMEWLGDKMDPLRKVYEDHVAAPLLPAWSVSDVPVDRTGYHEIRQKIQYLWTTVMLEQNPEEKVIPLCVEFTHGASYRAREPAPYSAAQAKCMSNVGSLLRGKERTIKRSRLRGIQKRKYERWLQIDSPYQKKGPKKPHQHHTTRPTSAAQFRGKMELLHG